MQRRELIISGGLSGLVKRNLNSLVSASVRGRERNLILRKLSLALTLALMIASLLLPNVHAQGITAFMDKSVYYVGEPMTLTIRNNGPNTVGITMWVHENGQLTVNAHFLTDIAPGGQYTATEVASQPGSYKLEFRGTDYTTNTNSWATVQYQIKAQTAGPPFDFAIQIAPQSATVEQGKTANYQILITYSSPAHSGTQINIQVTGVGPGMTYQVTPSPPGLAVFTSKTTPPGTYTIVLIASAMGVTHQTTAYLTVTSQQPAATTTATVTSTAITGASDFSISASPSDLTIFQGDSASFSLVMDKVGDFNQGVTLAAFGLPSGASAVFNPASGKPHFTATLTITTAEATPSGTYTVTVDASGGGKTHSATVTLTIKQKTKQTPTSTTSTHAPETAAGGSDLAALVTNPLNLSIIAIAVVAIAAIAKLSTRKKQTTQLPQSPTRHCGHCGAALKSGRNFCTSCGRPADTT